MTEPPAMRGMSKEYNKQIASLGYMFIGIVRTMPFLELTQEQIDVGTDSLKGKWKTLVAGAGEFWFHYRDYDLSYNQINLAFWWAIRECEKLRIVKNNSG